jgi:hypothetical protein
MTFAVGLAALAAGTSHAEDRLPGTMNFTNVTGTNINQTVPETATNVKEVEHGDFDNDGDLDVAVAAAGGVFGNRRNKLYRNDEGVFNEVSGSPIISGFTVQDLTRHAFFRDYDGDGWLDLCIANDDLGGGGPFKLYMNQHPGGVFSHFAEEGAARGLTFEASCGGVSIDADNDGDWDIYSGNYPGPSQDRLYTNNGDGTFSIITSTHVPEDGDYTIDVGSSDFNGDGKLDLLVANHTPNYVYYNDKNNEGTEPGDYKYGTNGTGGKQNLGTSGADGAMEPGDFNNDGMVDFYWTNKVGSQGDRIVQNMGTNANGMVTWSDVMPPAYATSSTANKSAVEDLNNDGRVDIVVGVTSGRPAILRNTSVNGIISFVDWTPASAAPSGTSLRAHHSGLFDANGDGYRDVFVGGDANDHLLLNVETPSYTEAKLGGSLPALWNSEPVAVEGAGEVGSSDIYTVSATSGGFLSIVASSGSDVRIIVRNPSGGFMGSSNRGDIGVEEALQVQTTASGAHEIEVITLACADSVDTNGDCMVDVQDLVNVILAWGSDQADADGNDDGVVDVQDLVNIIVEWGPVDSSYVLEVLGRTG